MKFECMDIAIFIVCTRCLMVISESLSVEIVGKIFRIKITEDHLAPMRMVMKDVVPGVEVKGSSSYATSIWGDDDFCLQEESCSVASLPRDGTSIPSPISSQHFEVVNQKKNMNSRCKKRAKKKKKKKAFFVRLMMP